MPSYITYAEVVSSTDTAVLQPDVEALIDRAENWLAGQLAKHNVSADTSNGILQEAVMERTIANLYTREQMDGTRPGSLVEDGTLTMTSNIPAAISHHTKRANDLVEDYAREDQGDPWAESSADSEATVVRQDRDMGQYHMDQTQPRQYHDRAGDDGAQDNEVT